MYTAYGDHPVNDLFQRMEDAWNRGDLDYFYNCYAVNATCVARGRISGRETIHIRLRQKFSSHRSMGSFRYELLEFQPQSRDLFRKVGMTGVVLRWLRNFESNERRQVGLSLVNVGLADGQMLIVQDASVINSLFD